MLVQRRLSTAVVWLLYAVAGARTAAAEPPQPLQNGFVERENPEVAVGGVYLVGFMRAPVLPRANERELYVWIPEERFARLCARVQSIDGRYVADAEYDIARTERGRYRLSFGARRLDLLRRYSAGELILDGRVGSSCDQPESLTHVPMAWSERASGDPLIFFVNTDGHDAVLQLPLRSDPEQVQSVPCATVPSKWSRRVFSAYCVVEQPSAIDFSEAWLELSRFGEVQVTELLDVLQTAAP